MNKKNTHCKKMKNNINIHCNTIIIKYKKTQKSYKKRKQKNYEKNELLRGALQYSMSDKRSIYQYSMQNRSKNLQLEIEQQKMDSLQKNNYVSIMYYKYSLHRL